MTVGIGMMIGGPVIGLLSDRILKNRKWTLTGAAFQTFMGYLIAFVGKKGTIYPPEAYSLAFKFCLIAAAAGYENLL